MMKDLTIGDLDSDIELDREARRAIAGGLNGWVMDRLGGTVPNVVNAYFDFSHNPTYNIAVQPTTINVGNGIAGGGAAGGVGVASSINLTNTPINMGDINLITAAPEHPALR